ncbi:MAG: alpha/beta hydrolase, partial [Planctomycetaceae bacterium]
MIKLPEVLTTTLLCWCVVATFCVGTAAAQDAEFRPLWPDGPPGAQGTADADRPGLWIYPATDQPGAASSGTAVVICPGGGYGLHAVDHEGTQPARFFNRLGITAFVLRYRLAPYRHPIPLNDALRAIRFVRAHAEEFRI